jgi:hypothetical protein
MFHALDSPEKIETFFRKNFGDSVPLMPKLVEDYPRNPVGSLVTIRCKPWWFDNKAVLLGDAAHAIVPFYGQGMNAAFEDCAQLALELKSLRELPEFTWRAFTLYESFRRPNTDAIADMALHNFIEMRDHTASRVFLLKKKLSHLMHRLFPRAFVPLYNMVSFSTIPYAQARERARWQSRVLRFAACGFALLLLVILALFLNGVGWNMAFVAGSALLTDALAPNERASVQGLADLFMGLMGALGSATGGMILGIWGFAILNAVGAVLVLGPLTVTLLRRQALSPREG